MRGKSGYWSLLVLGGKSSKTTWLNSVQTLDLLPYFRPGTMVKNAVGQFVKASSQWQDCKSMVSERANFAI